MLTPVPTRRSKRVAPEPAARSSAEANVGADSPVEEIAAATPSACIAEALRRTTMRAHEAIRRDVPDVAALRDLLFEVASLEIEADRLELRALRPFLDSLHRRIEAAI